MKEEVGRRNRGLYWAYVKLKFFFVFTVHHLVHQRDCFGHDRQNTWDICEIIKKIDPDVLVWEILGDRLMLWNV